MTPCYQRHELAPGIHTDIPHEHQGAPVKTMAEVLTAHSVFEFDDESRLYRCRCGVWMADEDAAEHQADALTAAGFGPVKAAAAGALRDAAEALDLQPPKLKAQYVKALRLYAEEPWRLNGP